MRNQNPAKKRAGTSKKKGKNRRLQYFGIFFKRFPPRATC